MQYLTLSDTILGLEDLQKNRASLLQSCKSGQIYGVLLGRCLAQSKKLPSVLFTSRPLTEELAATDNRHDSGFNKVRSMTDSVIDDPLAEKDLLEAALRIRRDLVPSAKIVGASYPTEAANAKERRSKLSERKADLLLFPLPGGKTLYNAAEQFLDAGDELDVLLSERAKLDAVTDTDRSQAGVIRNDVVGLLNRFRAALEDELEADEVLPRNLPAQILGYFEQLNETRHSQRQESAAKKQEKKPEA